MDPVYLITLAVFLPLITGLLTLFLPKAAITPRVLLATSGPVASFLLLLNHISTHGVVSLEQPVGSTVIPWIPTLNLNVAFLTDGLGLFFALLVSGIGTLIVLYARGYFGKNQADLFRFYPTLGFFTTAMIGIVLADYILLTLLFWEMTSISSFLLIGWDRYDKKAVKLAMQAFFTTGLGGMGLFGGLLLFGFATSTLTTDGTGMWRWSEILANRDMLLANGFITSPNMIGAFVLMFIGAATKSAQFPWHYWLPGAMAAPTPVSAFLHSATMVKTGVFLTGRMFPLFQHLELWPWFIVSFGAITMLLGALLAINQHDLKRIFAYTTVSQLGLLMCMYGLGAFRFTSHGHEYAAIDWDITQIANHAFYKAPLFIIAGALGHVASRDITQLFGAIKKHKAMCLTMLLAAYALAAGPGTISFQAKELFLYAVWHSKDAIGNWWMVLMAMTIITAVCNVAIFVRLFTTLLGLPTGMRATHEHHDEHHHEHEHGFWAQLIWLPGLAIVSLQYVGGLYTPLWNKYFGYLESNTHNYFHDAYHGIPSLATIFSHEPSLPLYMSGLAIVGGVILGVSPLMRRQVTDFFDRVYPAMYWLSVSGGRAAFGLIQTGNLRHYFIFVLLALLVGFTGAVLIDENLLSASYLDTSNLLEFWPGLLIGIFICITALVLPAAQSRVLRVLLLGACGFSVVGMYLIYQAPDLALTQLMFEIISVILFVLVLRLLPEPPAPVRAERLWRILLATAVGLVFGWMTLVAANTDSMQPLLAQFFADHSYHGTELTHHRGGGGKNIVNVILVDFRGFDTLGEITVLSLAVIGVWSLIPALKQNRFTRRKPKLEKEPA